MNTAILLPYKNVHILSILDGTVEVPDKVYYLVEELTEDDSRDDLIHVLVKVLID